MLRLYHFTMIWEQIFLFNGPKEKTGWEKIECKLSIYQEKLNQKYCDVNIVFNQRDAQLYQKYYGEMPDAIIPISPQLRKLIGRRLHGQMKNLTLCKYCLLGRSITRILLE